MGGVSSGKLVSIKGVQVSSSHIDCRSEKNEQTQEGCKSPRVMSICSVRAVRTQKQSAQVPTGGSRDLGDETAKHREHKYMKTVGLSYKTG